MKPEELTAWALNELSPDERQKLEAALETDPAAKSEAEATQAFCEFLSRELHESGAALTAAQRKSLASLAPNAALPPRSWIFRSAAPLGIAAAVGLAGLAAWQQGRKRLEVSVESPLSKVPSQPVVSPAENARHRVEEGDRLYAEGDTASALAQYSSALTLLQKADPNGVN